MLANSGFVAANLGDGSETYRIGWQIGIEAVERPSFTVLYMHPENRESFRNLLKVMDILITLPVSSSTWYEPFCRLSSPL